MARRSLTGARILLTGASSGIGRAIALELAPGFFAIETGVFDPFLVDEDPKHVALSRLDHEVDPPLEGFDEKGRQARGEAEPDQAERQGCAHAPDGAAHPDGLL